MKIPLDAIHLATNNFDEKYLIGSGGFGEVYKAELKHVNIRCSLATKLKSEDEHPKLPNTVAIKRIFHREDGQGKEGFLAELEVLSKCEHPNIVNLLGICVERDERLLVYEHASNGSLDDYLGSNNNMINLTWAQRLKVCIDIAHGLSYLHTTMVDKKWIIHRDIKSDNILLGENWEAKIADFGLSKYPANQQESTINTNHIAGTYVYLDPEYARTGYCKEMNEKIIVYENASNGSLDKYLNDASFSWTERLKVCIDIAKGLRFLHGGDVGKDVVIHRDIKSSNILLNKDWNAKICGFELALTYPIDEVMKYAIDHVVGSPGYCDPLYWETHMLTKESDMYSFGVVLFEILCGRLACPKNFRDRSQFLDVLVKRQFKVARLDEIVFEGIKEKIAPKSLSTFRRIAFQCLHEDRKERPTAGQVLVQLQKALEIQEAYVILEGAKLRSNYKEVLRFSNSTNYSTMAKRYINDILSKGILLEEDKQEIIRVLQQPT
ncbi:hypothetical protein M8C21_023224 [Ambrosia artemisiifolia]|uniref:Protein kinase domain-containing protein n=1 Tax=Ambrosia artemisiifolia TaxID=4212 RepID=A0AAD5GKM4_AMBAR|nr:hypothetical protein M8C21_023224 [Ambrosia artemisiifolia]